MNIPFLNPTLGEEDIAAAAAALRSGWITMGDDTKAFEREFAAYLGAGHTVVNSSGTAALHVAMLAAGIGAGDEIITTPISYVATSNAAIYVGAKPVFVDVEPDTALIDVSKIEAAITPKTKAIVPVHLYGQMADMVAITALAKKHNLLVIEDAPHAIEASRDSVRPGEKSFAACWSFHAAKNITAGEGGAVTVHDVALAEKVRLLTESGVDKSGSKRRMVMLGYKYSFTNYQSALLRGQLARIEELSKRRAVLYKRYAAAMDELGIAYPKQVPNSRHAHHMFVIHVSPEKRDSVRDALLAKGVQTSIHYDPIHLEPYYRKQFGYNDGDFPVAEKLGFSTITLPLYTALTDEMQEYVIASLKEITKIQ